MSPYLSVIVPARNEEALIEGTVRAAAVAADVLRASSGLCTEILVVDNASVDDTAERAAACGRARLVRCDRLGAARARNAGAARAEGQVLVFVDADTRLEPDALEVVAGEARRGALAGICRLGTFDGGLRAALWWGFWNGVRHLPLPRAKAMPAFMFCTREAFDRFGPFDASVAIGEEWPILARVYREERSRFVHTHRVLARTSSRRMETQPFGYSANFLKYVWAVLHRTGRVRYTDAYR